MKDRFTLQKDGNGLDKNGYRSMQQIPVLNTAKFVGTDLINVGSVISISRLGMATDLFPRFFLSPVVGHCDS